MYPVLHASSMSEGRSSNRPRSVPVSFGRRALEIDGPEILILRERGEPAVTVSAVTLFAQLMPEPSLVDAIRMFRTEAIDHHHAHGTGAVRRGTRGQFVFVPVRLSMLSA